MYRYEYRRLFGILRATAIMMCLRRATATFRTVSFQILVGTIQIFVRWHSMVFTFITPVVDTSVKQLRPLRNGRTIIIIIFCP